MQPTLATEEEVKQAWQILKKTGAYREGHFLFPETGYHYDRFFQLPLAYEFSRNARILAVTLSRMIRRSGLLNRLDPDRTFTLIAPSDVALPVAFWTGDVLEADRVLWMPKFQGGRGFHQFVELDERDQVVLLTDIMFTGSQVAWAFEQIQARGACIKGVVVIVDRREEPTHFNGTEVYSLLQIQGRRYSPEDCPLCEQGVELTEIHLG